MADQHETAIDVLLHERQIAWNALTNRNGFSSNPVEAVAQYEILVELLVQYDLELLLIEACNSTQ